MDSKSIFTLLHSQQGGHGAVGWGRRSHQKLELRYSGAIHRF
jgi:hypothetical protein